MAPLPSTVLTGSQAGPPMSTEPRHLQPPFLDVGLLLSSELHDPSTEEVPTLTSDSLRPPHLPSPQSVTLVISYSSGELNGEFTMSTQMRCLRMFWEG